jgi:hypothetical protein
MAPLAAMRAQVTRRRPEPASTASRAHDGNPAGSRTRSPPRPALPQEAAQAASSRSAAAICPRRWTSGIARRSVCRDCPLAAVEGSSAVGSPVAAAARRGGSAAVERMMHRTHHIARPNRKECVCVCGRTQTTGGDGSERAAGPPPLVLPRSAVAGAAAPCAEGTTAGMRYMKR